MAIKIILPLIALFAVLTFLLLPAKIPLSPLSQVSFPANDLPSADYLILGFAPYWNLKKLSPESLNTITHFAYFNLHLNEDGSLYTRANRREEDPGYTNYKRLVAGDIDYNHKPLILTFMPESQAALTSILSSPSARATAITTILDMLKTSESIGVNIDFEPLGETPPSLRQNFTLFIDELRLELDSLDRLDGLDRLLTISIYASASSRPRLWDLSALRDLTDYFIVMTYDYTMPVSDNAGPNSPLRGAGELFEHDIIKNIAEITRIIDSRKILLGIPFYGYEWDTADRTKYSSTEGRGSVASLERIDAMLAAQTLELLWDRNTLTPYGVASVSGQVSQIYFENTTSIQLKLDFVKSANLGGIAIWALGYEGSNPALWNTISFALSPRP